VKDTLGGKAAVAGIGQTEFSKESGRTELQLACEAVKAALEDAGLQPGDVDGMVTFTVDENEEIEVARNLGISDLTFFTRVPHGGGAAAGTVMRWRWPPERRRRWSATAPSTSAPASGSEAQGGR